MIYSMTGYGSSSHVLKGQRGILEISADIRTFNAKFLDIQIRSPRSYSVFDMLMMNFIRNHLRRGRVEVTVCVRLLEGRSREISVNLDQASALYRALHQTADHLGLKEPVSLQTMLALPDWIESREAVPYQEEEWQFLKGVLEKALAGVEDSRRQEGDSLKAAVQNHLHAFQAAFLKIEENHDNLLEAFRQRTMERIKKLLASTPLDAQRLEQEVTVWVARSDFREEIDRISHHLKSFDKILNEGGDVGRRLEFVLQECQREVNTLGTKCPDPQWIQWVVEMKSQMERIREQIQNIE